MSYPIARLRLSTATLNFGNCPVGQSVTANVTLICYNAYYPDPNVEPEDYFGGLSFSSGLFTNNTQHQFLQPGESLVLPIVFTPTAEGNVSASATVIGTTRYVTLTATATAGTTGPSIVASPSEYNFGTAVVGSNTLTIPGNNTSGSSDYKHDSSVPLIQTNFNAGQALDKSDNPTPINISKVDIHSLIYSGNTTQVFAHWSGWFGASEPHIAVGYNSDDVTQVGKQVDDMVSRGINGVIAEWYGDGAWKTDLLHINQATTKLKNKVEITPNFQFALCYCKMAWDGRPDQTQEVIDDLTYANTNYFGSSRYWKYNGRPVFMIFDHDTDIDWAAVKTACVNFSNGQPLFIFRNGVGFGYAGSDGAFAWVDPDADNASDQSGSHGYLDDFWYYANQNPTKLAISSAFPRFNGALTAGQNTDGSTGTGWSVGKLIPHQYGKTWLEWFSYNNTKAQNGNKLKFLQVPWNDVEEGHALEFGVANNVAITAVVNNRVLSWTVTAGDEITVSRYRVLYGAAMTEFASVAVGASYSVNISNIPAGAEVIVEAQGKPCITNRYSNKVNGPGALFTIQNPSQASLSVTGISFTAPFVAGSPTPGPVTIPAGSEATFGGAFSPTEAGEYDVANGIIIANNAGPDVLIRLLGTTVTAMVTLDKYSVSLDRGGQVIITASVSTGSVTWTCTTQSRIAANGLSCTFTATSDDSGTYTVRATSDADPAAYAECVVTIVGVSVTLMPSQATLDPGKSLTIVAVITGGGNVTWTCNGDPLGSGAGTRIALNPYETGVIFEAGEQDTGTFTIRATHTVETSIYDDCVVTISTLGVDTMLSKTLWPTLKGLRWDVKMTPEFFGFEHKSVAPGFDTELSFGPDPLYHFECEYEVLRERPGFDERRALQSFFEARRGKWQSFLLYMPTLTQNPDDGIATGQVLTPDVNGYAPIVVTRQYRTETIYELAGVNGNPGRRPLFYMNGTLLSSSQYTVRGPGLETAGGTYPGLVVQLLIGVTGQVTADFTWYYRVRFEQSKQEFNLFCYLLWEAQQVKLISTRT